MVYYAQGSGNLIFEGRAHIEHADPERKGVAIIIDLDKVTGRIGGERMNMARAIKRADSDLLLWHERNDRAK